MARRKKYNRYDDEFKATAVALTEIKGVKATHVAEALDIHEVMYTVGVWKCAKCKSWQRRKISVSIQR